MNSSWFLQAERHSEYEQMDYMGYCHQDGHRAIPLSAESREHYLLPGRPADSFIESLKNRTLRPEPTKKEKWNTEVQTMNRIFHSKAFYHRKEKTNNFPEVGPSKSTNKPHHILL